MSTFVLQYATNYWANHLFLASFGDQRLQDALELLIPQFFSEGLDETHAHLVVQWLKVGCFVIYCPSKSVNLTSQEIQWHQNEFAYTVGGDCQSSWRKLCGNPASVTLARTINPNTMTVV